MSLATNVNKDDIKTTLRTRKQHDDVFEYGRVILNGFIIIHATCYRERRSPYQMRH